MADWLTARGVSILGMNVLVGRAEIDLLVREGDVVAVVEVRARAEDAWVAPLDTVIERKRRRLRTAGERLWAQRFERDASVATMRFDVVSVRWTSAGTTEVAWDKGVF